MCPILPCQGAELQSQKAPWPGFAVHASAASDNVRTLWSPTHDTVPAVKTREQHWLDDHPSAVQTRQQTPSLEVNEANFSTLRGDSPGADSYGQAA
jgi:hypothetical protein